jgi:uncharacterized membrane protein
MSFYTLIVFVHIAAGVLLLSTSIVGDPLVRAGVRRTRARQDLRAFLELGRSMSLIAPMAALLVLASGAYLATAGHFWTLGWIQVSSALWILNGVVVLTVVRPALRRLEAKATESGPSLVDAELDELRRARGWSWGLDLVATNDAAVLALMTLRPSLGGSILLVLVANFAVAAARRALGLRPPRVAAAGLPSGS